MPLESQIPLPTDNIYKFYALFGLLLFIFSFGLSVYVSKTTNKLLFQTLIDQETLKQLPNPSSVEKTKEQVLQRRIEIAVQDRNFDTRALGAVGGIAFCVMVYGFWKWHREVQPVQDKIAELQLEKLRLEVSQMKTACKPPATSPPSEDDSGSPS